MPELDTASSASTPPPRGRGRHKFASGSCEDWGRAGSFRMALASSWVPLSGHRDIVERDGGSRTESDRMIIIGAGKPSTFQDITNFLNENFEQKNRVIVCNFVITQHSDIV
jgi:hypothetical protein